MTILPSQLGPFIDSEHPEIKKGTINESFDELFQIEVSRKVRREIDSM